MSFTVFVIFCFKVNPVMAEAARGFFKPLYTTPYHLPDSLRRKSSDIDATAWVRKDIKSFQLDAVPDDDDDDETNTKRVKSANALVQEGNKNQS